MSLSGVLHNSQCVLLMVLLHFYPRVVMDAGALLSHCCIPCSHPGAGPPSTPAHVPGRLTVVGQEERQLSPGASPSGSEGGGVCRAGREVADWISQGQWVLARVAGETRGEPLGAMRLLICLTSALVLCASGEAAPEPSPTAGHSPRIDEGNFPNRDHTRQGTSQYQQQVLDPSPGL